VSCKNLNFHLHSLNILSCFCRILYCTCIVGYEYCHVYVLINPNSISGPLHLNVLLAFLTFLTDCVKTPYMAPSLHEY
jgi:hypothetical protein